MKDSRLRPKQGVSRFDSYWRDLLRCVDDEGEILTGNERLFSRLPVIRGGLYTEGFHPYLEFKHEHIDEDIHDLQAHGFADVAQSIRARVDDCSGMGS
jgi:hypothetical protein